MLKSEVAIRKLPFADSMVFDESNYVSPITDACMETLSPELKQIVTKLKTERDFEIEPGYSAKIANALRTKKVRSSSKSSAITMVSIFDC